MTIRRPTLKALAQTARDLRATAVTTQEHVDGLQETIAAVFARAPDSEVRQVLCDLFATTTLEGRTWGEYIWLLMAFKHLNCPVPEEDLDRARQRLIDMLQELV